MARTMSRSDKTPATPSPSQTISAPTWRRSSSAQASFSEASGARVKTASPLPLRISATSMATSSLWAGRRPRVADRPQDGRQVRSDSADRQITAGGEPPADGADGDDAEQEADRVRLPGDAGAVRAGRDRKSG